MIVSAHVYSLNMRGALSSTPRYVVRYAVPLDILLRKYEKYVVPYKKM